MCDLVFRRLLNWDQNGVLFNSISKTEFLSDKFSASLLKEASSAYNKYEALLTEPPCFHWVGVTLLKWAHGSIQIGFWVNCSIHRRVILPPEPLCLPVVLITFHKYSFINQSPNLGGRKRKVGFWVNDLYRCCFISQRFHYWPISVFLQKR